MPACPNCGSQKVWKDGLRYTACDSIQRYRCRECGYRFSENSGKQKNRELLRKFAQGLECQDCDESQRGALVSLMETISLAADPQNEKRAAGATETDQGQTADIKGKLVEYAWYEKKRGLAETTIVQRIYKLKELIKRGASLLNPESVSAVLASSNLSPSYKKSFIIAYKSFCKAFKLAWEPPKVRVERKVPFIPTEAEIDTLIAGCGRKTAAFLQVLKDTGARGSEACRLKWEDIDEKTNTIRINNPTKGSLARVVKVSPKTIAMLNSLPRNGEYIFNTNISSIRKNFTKQRNKIAAKLQNPRLKQIHLHTIRHWKATMEYYKTKNIKWVQYVLGHKKIENTDIYTHLVNFEGDEWHVAVAKDLEEEKKLIEIGFEFVRYSERDGVAIYRKRK
jgi:integrase